MTEGNHFSEPAQGHWIRPGGTGRENSEITDRDRIKLIELAVRQSESAIGGPLEIFGREATLLERLQHILKLARSHNVYAAHYAIVWNMERVLNKGANTQVDSMSEGING